MTQDFYRERLPSFLVEHLSQTDLNLLADFENLSKCAHSKLVSLFENIMYEHKVPYNKLQNEGVEFIFNTPINSQVMGNIHGILIKNNYSDVLFYRVSDKICLSILSSNDAFRLLCNFASNIEIVKD